MFKLQRLEITGFKSFADYTELVFTGEGITAIVGPNGCGKSNVSDAISWVLGEQRVKHLRGSDMKDVIFQGSRNRAPSGMAEVVLHLTRDETTEEEPDIEDIDSTLEGIDEHEEQIEAKLAPEIIGEAAGLEASDAETHHAAQGAQTSEPAVADGGATAAVTEQSQTAPFSSSTDLVAAAAPGSEELTAKARQHTKRHWRPRRLALGFAPGETVSVARRLYRDGESEYLLNGRACRLRDIQDLFSGTGLSGAHYAIVEQGRIGQILSAKPMDRRTLIEEAAGITKFRVRQRAAEARLESARMNLRRVSDIVSEIDRQVGSLRRQAAKARRYRSLREELRELLRRVYAADERALNLSLEMLRAQLEAAGEEERALASELEDRGDETRAATATAREREEELATARAAVAEAALRRDRRERERAYREEQAESLEQRVADIESQMGSLRERLAGVRAEGEALRAGETRLRDESERSAESLRSAEADYARLLGEVLEAESQIESARAELLTHTAVAERLSEIGRQLEATLERLAAQAEGLEREGERARAAHAEFESKAAAVQVEIDSARGRLDKLLVEREAAAAGVAAARSLVSATLDEYARMREDAARVRNRLETLAELDAKRSLYSQAVQRIFSDELLDEAERDPSKDFHTVGTLADMLRVEPQWERAVEGIFGGYLQTVIVPTPDDASRAAAWLAASGAGRATFLVAGIHGAGVDDAGDAYSRVTVEELGARDVRLSDVLGAPRELLSVLGRTLRREMGARIVASLEEATAGSYQTGELYVTLDGEWVSGGQLVGAGGAAQVDEATGLLAFKREMRELETRAAELASEVVSAEDSLSAARARLVELEEALLLLNEQIGREEREQVARELSASQLAQEVERAARHTRVVAEDAARLAEERREIEGRRATQLAELGAAEGSRLAAAQAVASAGEVLAEARRRAEVESERLSGERAAAAAAAERRRATASELRRTEAESADLEARLERHAAEVEEMRGRIAEVRRALEEMEESAGTVESEAERLQTEVERATGRLSAARARADELADELSELNQRAADAREARAQLEINRAEAAARLNYLRESCVAELSQTLEEIVAAYEPDAGFDLEAGRARVEELRARLEGFGAVNLMALEELGESEERFAFLTTQRKDIEDGIHSTEEALREIKKRSRERFRHAFEEINRNFGQLFLELFGGGRGEMSMIDADDVLESGIDIIAQPPGKRLQNVLLLSGGEKAMAALALVLAIFRYRPSPFCLLDEVDAPLDEANIGRFTAKIVEMATETQFLVITHNKRTMEMARALYGVTMEDAGISKLVSVAFE